MKILLVKLTSMGDLIQMLPALTDASRAFPGIQFDWVVEESFQEIAKVHPAVNRVITLSYRQWKGRLLSALFLGEIKQFYRALRAERYDMVIDAQSNIKSSVVTLFARGLKYGLDKTSVREYGAQFAYNKKICIDRNQNHLLRMRKLLATFLGYPLPQTQIDYGIPRGRLPKLSFVLPKKFVFITHIASRKHKLWPEPFWEEVIDELIQRGFEVVLPWWSQEEKERSLRLKKAKKEVHLLPQLSLSEKMTVLSQASLAISLDTGLGHMAASLNIPNVSLNGPSSAQLTGPLGQHQIHFDATAPTCAPCNRSKCTYSGPVQYTAACLESITPTQVLGAVARLIHLTSA